MPTSPSSSGRVRRLAAAAAAVDGGGGGNTAAGVAPPESAAMPQSLMRRRSELGGRAGHGRRVSSGSGSRAKIGALGKWEAPQRSKRVENLAIDQRGAGAGRRDGGGGGSPTLAKLERVPVAAPTNLLLGRQPATVLEE